MIDALRTWGARITIFGLTLLAAFLLTERLTRRMSAQATCPCSVWDAAATPAVMEDPDPNSVELGMKFQASVNGYVTAIRFYKSAGNTGHHMGNLWSATGTWLGTVTFTNETASGWQEARLQRPVAITANTTYIASYFAPVGHYSVTSGGFGSAGRTNGPLHALGTAEGANGVFHYGTGGIFPDQQANDTNYWVDVVFETSLPAQPLATEVGQWSRPLTWPVVTVHATLEPTGDVLVWDGHPVNGGESAKLWHPSNGTFSDVPNLFTNLFCAGHAMLPDGRTAVFGGHAGVAGALGTTDTNIFDPLAQAWTAGAKMAAPRWYPTATGLADGRVLVISGGTTCQTCFAETPEVYDPLTNTWTALTGAKLPVPLYPYMFVLPDGRVLEAGADADPTPTRILDVDRQTWTVVDPAIVDGGSAAMYRTGKVIKSGSAYLKQPATPAGASTYVLDMSLPAPSWRETAPMAFPRAHHNLTILPDGDVLVTGGTNVLDGGDPATAVYEAELWSPATETWRTMAKMDVPRMYHSVALLLPDARVLVAGGGRDFHTAPAEMSAEIYSPPYLFNGPRPTIASAPATVGYGGSFFVATPDAAAIKSVSFMRLGSVTHSFNMDQRYLELPFQKGTGGLTIQGPATAAVAPPGFYMLFLVNTAGVPSVAAIVQAAGQSPAPPPPPPASAPSISGIAASVAADGTATVTWTTDLASDSRVAYGTAAGALTLNASNAAAVTSHAIALTGLAAGTYYYRVTSATSGQATTSPAAALPPATFTVPAPPPTASAETLWDPATTPAVIDANDASAVELGVKFRARVNGSITALRFYKSAENNGPHTGSLWTTTGTLLGTVTFTNETASGWQEARFDSPVAIAANSTYIASYFTPTGHYSFSSAYFAAAGTTRGSLEALGNAESPNGVYHYGSGFPDQSFNAGNYWVDVAFVGAPPTPAPDYTIAATPATQTVAAGATATYTLALATTGGFSSAVTFSVKGLPAGATASASPASVSGAGSSTLTVATSAATPAGTYPLAITATSASGVSHTAPVTLVIPAPPAFSLSVSPASATVRQGAHFDATIKVTVLSGFTGTVTLSVSGLPGAATASFDSTSFTKSGSTKLRINTSNSTPPGSYVVTVTGTGVGQRTAAIALQIKAR